MSGLWLKAVLDNSGLLPLAGSGVMPVMMVSDMLGCLPSDFRGYLIELRRVKRSALSISRMRSVSAATAPADPKRMSISSRDRPLVSGKKK